MPCAATSQRRRTSVRAVALLAAAGLLVACGEDSSGASDPPTSTVAASTALSTPSTSTSAADTTSSTGAAAAWAEDLDLLDSTVRARHPEPFWKTDEATWADRIDELKRTLPTMDDEQATVEVMKLVALLDTHAAVFPEEVGFQLYPLALYEFSDGLFVINAKDPELVGSRVTAIGGMPVADALERITPLVSGDNDSGVRYLRGYFMVCAECLHAVGITDDIDHPGFELNRLDGTTVTVDLPPVSFDDFLSTVLTAEVPLFVVGSATGPEAVARRAEPVWWRVDEADSTFLLSYNSTGTDTSEALNAMTEALDQGSVTRVVLDMRYAQGGSFDGTSQLRQTLAGDPRLEQPGALTVMIGRENVSAGTGLASWLDANTSAELVGEPTPARPNPPVDETTFVLPNSGIPVHIPTGQIKITDASDTRTGVMPDVPASVSSAEFFAGADPVLEQVLTTSDG